MCQKMSHTFFSRDDISHPSNIHCLSISDLLSPRIFVTANTIMSTCGLPTTKISSVTPFLSRQVSLGVSSPIISNTILHSYLLCGLNFVFTCILYAPTLCGCSFCSFVVCVCLYTSPTNIDTTHLSVCNMPASCLNGIGDNTTITLPICSPAL